MNQLQQRQPVLPSEAAVNTSTGVHSRTQGSGTSSFGTCAEKR